MIPRDYQNEAANSLFDYWSRKSGNPLIALPTATGKSVVIALFCYRAIQWFPATRILILTHVKELIEQNFDKLRTAWPQAPAGIYSAGLGRKETSKQITFGGVQSVIKNVEAFGKIDLVGIDEAHLVSPDDETRYQQVIERLKKANPAVKVFGLTATYWRKKQGVLTDQGLFTDIAYNRTKPEDFRRFIAEGFLSPLIAKPTVTKLELADVSMTGGDYNQKQLEAAVDKATVSHAALRELCNHGQDRRAWLVFCSGISHAEHCADILNAWGIRTGCVHSKLSSNERDRVIRDWYNGKLRCVTNNNVLTTGIDYPAIDLIGMLRPTMSSSLWVQMLGRGMRVSSATAKHNCLVLDFAGNTLRLGPVDDPVIPGRPREGAPGDAPVKICAKCDTYNHASARFCEYCGDEFPIAEKLAPQASTAALMSSALPVVETFPVTSVVYNDHMSKKGNRSVRVTYHSGVRAFSEYIDIEGGNGSFPLKRAHDWWKQRHHDAPPTTIEEALNMQSQLRVPTRVKVWVNKPYPEVVGYEFGVF